MRLTKQFAIGLVLELLMIIAAPGSLDLLGAMGEYVLSVQQESSYLVG